MRSSGHRIDVMPTLPQDGASETSEYVVVRGGPPSCRRASRACSAVEVGLAPPSLQLAILILALHPLKDCVTASISEDRTFATLKRFAVPWELNVTEIALDADLSQVACLPHFWCTFSPKSTSGIPSVLKSFLGHRHATEGFDGLK